MGMTVFASYDSSFLTMDSGAATELADYVDSLKGLKENNKPRINMLTMLAEESFHHGAAIVQLIEHHILQAEPSQKLPALYLIDSMVKNISHGGYRDLVRPRLIDIVRHIFSQLTDESIRRAIFKLRETWRGIFDDGLLGQLDRALQAIDPNWPVARSGGAVVLPVNAPIAMTHPLQISVTAPPLVKPAAPPGTPVEVANKERPAPEAIPNGFPHSKKASTPPEATERPGPDGAPHVTVPAKRLEHPSKTGPSAVANVKGIPRNARTVISQQKVSNVSVAYGSLEPPHGKPAPPAALNGKLPLPATGNRNRGASVEPLSDPVLSDGHIPRGEKEPISLPLLKSPRSPLEEDLKKPLPVIPRKLGPQGNRLQGNNPQPRRRPQPVPTGPARRLPPMARIPKRTLDQREPPQAENAPKRKFQKTVNGSDSRPPFAVKKGEERGDRHSPPPPGRDSRFVVKKYPHPQGPTITKYPDQVQKMHQPRQHYPPRHQPYPGRREPLIRIPPEQRFVAPVHPGGQFIPDSHWHARPQFMPQSVLDERNQLEMQMDDARFNPVKRVLMPTPVVDERSVLEIQMEDARRKLSTGEFNTAQYELFKEQAERDFELDQLRLAVDVSLKRVSRSRVSPNVVNIDGDDCEVHWVRNKPVVVRNGLILDISFKAGSAVDVFIDGIIHIRQVDMKETRTVYFGKGFHKIGFGGPNFELVVDEVTPIRVGFGGEEVELLYDGSLHRVRLGGPQPVVDFGSKPLNEEFFGPSPSEERATSSETVQLDDTLSRILASAAFAELTKSLAPVTVAKPPAVPVAPTRKTPAPVRPFFSVEQSRLRDKILAVYADPATYDHNTFSERVLVDGPVPELRWTRAGHEDRLFLAALEKFCLNAELYPYGWGRRPTAASDRSKLAMAEGSPAVPLAGEMTTHLKHTIISNGFVELLAFGARASEWQIDAADFTSEQSFVDTPSEVLRKKFTDRASTLRVGNTAPDGIPGDSSGALSAAVEDPDFHVTGEPVVDPGQKYVCSVCLDKLDPEENDAEDFVLTDGVQVTTKSDCVVKFYHRACFDQNIRQKPADDQLAVTLSKPSRWVSGTVDTPVPKKTPLSFRPSETVALANVSGKDSLKLDSLSSVEDVALSDPAPVEDFVINFGDDDDDEDDFADIIAQEADE